MLHLVASPPNASSSQPEASHPEVQSYPLSDPPADTISSLSWSPDSKFLAATSWNNQLRVWDITKPSEPSVFTSTGSGPIFASVWNSPTTISTGGADNIVRLHDLQTQTQLDIGNVSKHSFF